MTNVLAIKNLSQYEKTILNLRHKTQHLRIGKQKHLILSIGNLLKNWLLHTSQKLSKQEIACYVRLTMNICVFKIMCTDKSCTTRPEICIKQVNFDFTLNLKPTK